MRRLNVKRSLMMREKFWSDPAGVKPNKSNSRAHAVPWLRN